MHEPRLMHILLEEGRERERESERKIEKEKG